MKYVRGTRIWRDLRLLRPPGRWTLRGKMASLRQRRAAARARRARTRARVINRIGTCVTALVRSGAGHNDLSDGTRVRTAAAFLALWAPVLTAQSTAPPAYRAPTIALVQPPVGTTVPRDKPVVVFRFARGETADPVDIGTFTVTVNGVDRTALFQVTADEAWGALSKPSDVDSLIAAGSHAVSARVCSVRGACTETAATVRVVEALPPAPAPRPAEPQEKSRRARVIDLVIDAVRKLIVP